MSAKPKTVKAKKPRNLKPTKDVKGGMRKAGGDPGSAGKPFLGVLTNK
jgi:hypothetical protein